jgi:hypothetical protein
MEADVFLGREKRAREKKGAAATIPKRKILDPLFSHNLQ